MPFITFPITNCDDEEITCVACGNNKCDYELQIFGPGRRSWVGMHHKCASHHDARARWLLEEQDGENIILDEYDKPALKEKLEEEGYMKIVTQGNFVPSGVDHASLQGLADDDSPQYHMVVSGGVSDWEESNNE